MDRKLKILKNSFFLTVQPLLMNFISLFVVGYIARKLGTADFGIFNFVTMFTMLFFPVAMMGLNRLTVRDLSNIDDKIHYAGKMVSLRFLTTLLAIVLIIAATHTLDYPLRMEQAMYLACILFFFQTVSESFTDIINAFERMEFTALARFVAGITLTTLSVVVLYFGFGLFELIGVYALGQMLGCLLALWLALRILKFRPIFSWAFIREKISEGLPFFFMTFMWFAIIRLDTVFLSKKVSMSDLGIYTSAILLVARLSVIPQGIANSMLPAVSRLRRENKIIEIRDIVSSFMSKMVLLFLPGVIIVSFFSNDIIRIIFGEKYIGGGLILRIGIWAFLIRCIAFVEFSVLTAFHKQRQMVKAYLFGTIYCVISNFSLIHFYGGIGAVTALVTTQFVLLTFFSYYTYRVLRAVFIGNDLVKIILINVALVLFLIYFRSYSVFVIAPVSFAFYLSCAVLLKIIDPLKLKNLKGMIRPT